MNLTKLQLQQLRSICMTSQKELKVVLNMVLNGENNKDAHKVSNEDGFLYKHGEFPVLLVAHMDTVHKTPPSQIIEKDNIWTSPQGIGGDDRCGVFLVLQLLQKFDCSVVFCEDEETGGKGAQKFAEYAVKNDLTWNYMIEFDRMGVKDAVFYDCDNPEFTDFITANGAWKEAIGSFSDISFIAPFVEVAAVNLSSGYYFPHQLREEIRLSDLSSILTRAERLLDGTDPEKDKYEYIESTYSYNSWGGYNSIGATVGRTYGASTPATPAAAPTLTPAPEIKGFEMHFKKPDGTEGLFVSKASTFTVAIGEFAIYNPRCSFSSIHKIFTKTE